MAKGGITKLTPENLAKLEQAAAIGASIAEMAYYCDVSRQTVYNWLEEDKDLFDKIERLREKPILKARQTIVNDLDNPDTSKWFLSKRSKEFKDRMDITTDDKPIPLISLNDLRNDHGNQTGGEAE